MRYGEAAAGKDGTGGNGPRSSRSDFGQSEAKKKAADRRIIAMIAPPPPPPPPLPPWQSCIALVAIFQLCVMARMMSQIPTLGGVSRISEIMTNDIAMGCGERT